jgi:hypothetical protein
MPQVVTTPNHLCLCPHCGTVYSSGERGIIPECCGETMLVWTPELWAKWEDDHA